MPRGVKRKIEIDFHRRACQITDRIFLNLLKDLRSNHKIKKIKTEIDIKEFIENQMKTLKVKKSFPTIVASGKNAYTLHHKPTNANLSGFVVIDFGVIYKRYMSDMSRTIYFGKPSNTEIKNYEKVLQIEKDSIKDVKPNASCRELDLNARKMFGRNAKNFIHALGHGVGKKIHEFPKISPRSKFFLKTGMIITIEPGVYFEGKYGIRIEDTVLVTEKGREILTKSPKNLIMIK